MFDNKKYLFICLFIVADIKFSDCVLHRSKLLKIEFSGLFQFSGNLPLN